MNKRSSVPPVLLIDIEDKLAELISEEEAIELTQAFAKGINKEIPIIDPRDPFLSPNEVLKENIDCFSDDEKFEFIAQVQKLSYVKHNPEFEEEITDFLSYQDQMNGSRKSRNNISSLLATYPPKIRQQWIKAGVFFNNGDYRNALDNVRLTVELLVKNLTKSESSLENQKKNLGNFLEAKSIDTQIRNYVFKILNIYEKIQNDQAKHDVPESLSFEEVSFIMNQSYVIIKFLIDCDNKAF